MYVQNMHKTINFQHNLFNLLTNLGFKKPKFLSGMLFMHI